jgi:hypothetical protein
MNWLIIALSSYNKYLLRIESKVRMEDRIKQISESFEDNDKLTLHDEWQKYSSKK